MYIVLAEISFFHKLWDKGVDITANVVTGVILALFAFVAWAIQQRLAVWFEERRERQMSAIKRRLEEEREWARHRDEFLAGQQSKDPD